MNALEYVKYQGVGCQGFIHSKPSEVVKFFGINVIGGIIF